MEYSISGKYKLNEQQLKNLFPKIITAKVNDECISFTTKDRLNQREYEAISEHARINKVDKKAEFALMTDKQKIDAIAERLGLI